MLRKIALLASTAALLGGSLLVGSGAHASAPKIDVSNDHVACDTVYGSVGFAPPITATAGGLVVKIKGVVDGCVDTDNPNVHIIASSFSGKLTGSGNGFGSLLGLSTDPGTITIKWKTAKDSPLMQTQSIVTPNAVCGGLYSAAPPINGSYGEFHIGAQASCGGNPQPAPSIAAGGAFTGGDGGASSVTDAATSQSVTALGGAAATGIKSANLGLGNLSLG